MPSREEKKALTRRKLLDAAAELIAKNGAAGTSLDDIAERAGLTKGAIYSNFASKDELIWALAGDLPTIDFADVFDRDRSLADNLEELGRVLAKELSRTSDRSWMLALEIMQHAIRNAKMRRRLVAEQRANQSFSASALAELATATGDALPLPAEQLHVVVDALAFGLAHKHAIDPKSVPDEVFAKAFRLLAGSA